MKCRTFRVRRLTERIHPMQDVFWAVVTITFFAVSITYVHFCDRVK